MKRLKNMKTSNEAEKHRFQTNLFLLGIFIVCLLNQIPHLGG